MIKKIKKNILKSWITTIAGIIVILSVIASIFFVPNITWWPEGFVGISIGVILLFSPDTLINIIKGFIGNTKSSVSKGNNNEGSVNNDI